MHVTMLSRPPGRMFSVEEVFGTVAAHLPGDCTLASVHVPHEGASPAAVLRNLLWTRAHTRGLVHVTGHIQYAVLALPRQRSMLTVLDTRCIEGAPSLKKRLLAWLWFALPLRHAAVTTVISQATRDAVQQRFRIDEDRLRVIHCCVSPRFTFQQREFATARPRLLHVGVTNNKNLPRLADALRSIPCTLVILGQPTPEQLNHLSARGIETEVHHGLAPDAVPALYASCDIVTFASTYEGFGLPIVEGQAVGRPVLTSNCSSMPEVAGDGALLVNPFDVDSIRDGILRIIADAALREHLVQNGLENVRRFAPECIAAEYAAVYRELSQES